MLPDLISLALFVRVAETRSITKAAEANQIALADASRRLRLLEHHFAPGKVRIDGLGIACRSWFHPGYAVVLVALRAEAV